MSEEPNPSLSAADPIDPPADPPSDPPNDPPQDPPSDPPADPPTDKWGENWREEHSGGDEKTLKRLQRYTDPGAVINALTAAQNKIASGDMGAKLPENATETELADYRKATGVPETAADYDVQLPNGMVIGEEDQPTYCR